MGDKKKIATDLADKKVTDAKDAAKAEKDAAEQEAAAAKVDADKEVATAEAEAASTSIKNSGEVETLVKNVKEVASKSLLTRQLRAPLLLPLWLTRPSLLL